VIILSLNFRYVFHDDVEASNAISISDFFGWRCSLLSSEAFTASLSCVVGETKQISAVEFGGMDVLEPNKFKVLIPLN
jgi:hypothetical protein